jgi:hypothetical protein
MKHASWAIAGCLIAGAITAQPVCAQQTAVFPAQQYDLPAGSVGTMGPTDQKSTYSPYVHDPSPAQVRAVWGLDTPNKSDASPYIHNPTPAQVEAAWGQAFGPGKSFWNPWRGNHP